MGRDQIRHVTVLSELAREHIPSLSLPVHRVLYIFCPQYRSSSFASPNFAPPHSLPDTEQAPFLLYKVPGSWV